MVRQAGESKGLRRLMLMSNDFNRSTLPWYVKPVRIRAVTACQYHVVIWGTMPLGTSLEFSYFQCLEDSNCAQYVDGTAVHWYSDQWVGPGVMSETQALFPDKFLLYTEGCEGSPSAKLHWAIIGFMRLVRPIHSRKIFLVSLI